VGRILDSLNREISDLIDRVRDSVLMIVVEKFDILDILGLSQPVRGIGSGFVIGEGLAVTNAHVVGNAGSVSVLYPDGERGFGRVIARDSSRDLALVILDRRDARILRMGDSDRVRIGEIVFAIGSPLGLPGPSVSMGVVSAVGRTIAGVSAEGEFVLEDLIQTDAAINPGNSGGPLVNLEGEAIGISTAIIPYAQGIGFALPINHVKRFIQLLSKFGKPVRAWIGVYVAPLTQEIARSMGIGAKKGVIVVRVVPGSPAHEQGIQSGDIITRAGENEISKPLDLRKAIEDNIDKGEIKLEIIRRGRIMRLAVPIYIEEL